MAKRKSRPINKLRAIENALRRMGLQAGAKDVVAELAAFGIDVSESLVQVARVKMLKDAGGVKRRLAVQTGKCEGARRKAEAWRRPRSSC
jgi:hypothetical protein